MLFFSIFYPFRTVKKLVLLENHRFINLSTYSFFGKIRTFKVPVDNVSCSLSRNGPGSSLSMKVKGRPFYFLLDKKAGTFHDTYLFDHVVGLKRAFDK